MGIMEKKMETTIVYWGYIGIMENKMETTIMGYTGFRVYPRSRPSPMIHKHYTTLSGCRL